MLGNLFRTAAGCPSPGSSTGASGTCARGAAREFARGVGLPVQAASIVVRRNGHLPRNPDTIRGHRTRGGASHDVPRLPWFHEIFRYPSRWSIFLNGVSNRSNVPSSTPSKGSARCSRRSRAGRYRSSPSPVAVSMRRTIRPLAVNLERFDRGRAGSVDELDVELLGEQVLDVDFVPIAFDVDRHAFRPHLAHAAQGSRVARVHRAASHDSGRSVGRVTRVTVL